VEIGAVTCQNWGILVCDSAYCDCSTLQIGVL